MVVDKDVFVAGDCATFPKDGNSTRIEHWDVAMQQGKYYFYLFFALIFTM
jgi:NADH dehydrogenase FAD-containing subunit